MIMDWVRRVSGLKWDEKKRFVQGKTVYYNGILDRFASTQNRYPMRVKAVGVNKEDI